MEDSLTLIKNKQAELQSLYDRMDNTKDMVYLEPYVLKTSGGDAITSAYSVTSNKPAVFANAVISDMMGAKWQTVVEGVSPTMQRDIEHFINDNLSQIDELMEFRGEHGGLWTFIYNHVWVRSLIGAYFISQIIEDKYVIDCMPVDMRWCPFQYGKDGLLWAAPITYRSRAELESEYPGKLFSGDKDIEVHNFWDKDKNEVFVGGSLIFEQKNTLGYPPFVISAPATGFKLRDKGWVEHESEDALFMIRGLVEDLNRSLSVEMTVGMTSLNPSYEQESEDPNADADLTPLPGQTIKVKKGEMHQPLKRSDLNQAFGVARQDIMRDITQGSITDVDLGVITTSPGPSAILITRIAEIRAKFMNPRLQCVVAFRQQLARMMIKQFLEIKKGRDIKIGKTGRKTKYTASMLGDPDEYSIEVKLMTKSKEQEIANITFAQSAREFMSLKDILTNILQVEDPDGVIRQLEIEQARKADPAIALFEMALRSAQEAKELKGLEAEKMKIESKMLTERCVFLIKSRNINQIEIKGKAAIPEITEGGNGNNQSALSALISSRSKGQASPPKETPLLTAGGR